VSALCSDSECSDVANIVKDKSVIWNTFTEKLRLWDTYMLVHVHVSAKTQDCNTSETEPKFCKTHDFWRNIPQPLSCRTLNSILFKTSRQRAGKREKLASSNLRTYMYGNRAFHIASPKLWNSIPANLRYRTLQKNTQTFYFLHNLSTMDLTLFFNC